MLNIFKAIIIGILLIIINNSYVNKVSIEKVLSKKIILIGEHHFFTKNDSIQFSIIKTAIQRTKFKKTILLLERSIGLEYFIATKDSVELKKYFIYSKDRRFTNDSLSILNNMYYGFIKYIIKLQSENQNLEIRCIDVNHKQRPIYYILYLFSEKYNIIPRHLKDTLAVKLNSESLVLKDTIIFDSFRKFYFDNIHILKEQMEATDYQYLSKIINTPFAFNLNYSPRKRDVFMFNNIKEKCTKDNLLIYVGGNSHVAINQKDNLYNLCKKEFNTLFSKKVSSIGIAPNLESVKYFNLKYDYQIISNGKLVWKL